MALLGKVLIIVENLPVPFDRRVWMEATTLSKGERDIASNYRPSSLAVLLKFVTMH